MPSDLDINMLREICKREIQQQGDKKKIHAKEEVINRVKAEWCCRCGKTPNFSNEECVGRFCQHKRCNKCLEPNHRS